MKNLPFALLLLAGSAMAQQPAAPAAPPATPPLTHTEQVALTALSDRYQQVQRDLQEIAHDIEVAHPGYTLAPNGLNLVRKAEPAAAPATGPAKPKAGGVDAR